MYDYVSILFNKHIIHSINQLLIFGKEFESERENYALVYGYYSLVHSPGNLLAVGLADDFPLSNYMAVAASFPDYWIYH
ncbi:MAG: hypothetical protein HC811_12955 [Flammeovirgaceae bacterium]|nr:hypothetical protein [Flammeovirgaceae bacterium]